MQEGVQVGKKGNEDREDWGTVHRRGCQWTLGPGGIEGLGIRITETELERRALTGQHELKDETKVTVCRHGNAEV